AYAVNAGRFVGTRSDSDYSDDSPFTNNSIRAFFDEIEGQDSVSTESGLYRLINSDQHKAKYRLDNRAYEVLMLADGCGLTDHEMALLAPNDVILIASIVQTV